jgi:hypothetical protein
MRACSHFRLSGVPCVDVSAAHTHARIPAHTRVYACVCTRARTVTYTNVRTHTNTHTHTHSHTLTHTHGRAHVSVCACARACVLCACAFLRAFAFARIHVWFCAGVSNQARLRVCVRLCAEVCVSLPASTPVCVCCVRLRFSKRCEWCVISDQWGPRMSVDIPTHVHSTAYVRVRAPHVRVCVSE